MPKREPSATGPRLTAGTAAEQVAGLLTEVQDTPRQEVPAPDDAAPPAAPVPAPPAPPPPEPAATEPPPDESAAETYQVVVDGETLQVDLDELRAGYSKHEDYKRKTMALAEERKGFESEAQAVQAERAEFADGLRQLREALAQLQGEPDWAERRRALSAEDFLKEKADWELSKAQTDKLKAKEEEVRQQQRAEDAKRYQTYVRGEQDKLKTLWPDWADPEKAKTEAAKLRAQAKSYGFSDQEIDQVVDHRTMLLLRDALKYRELQREPNAKTQAKTPAIRPAKPGAAPAPLPANAHTQRYLEQAAKTGRLRDAQKALEALLPD